MTKTPYSLFSLRKHFIDGIVNPRYHHLKLDDLLEDIDHVIKSLAAKYADNTCVPLNYDILLSEGARKLAQLTDKFFFQNEKGEWFLERLSRSMYPTRSEFFKFFKATVKNHFRGLVQKHRFTEKRTGRKSPSRKEMEAMIRENIVVESTKNVELSLDDPNIGLQVSETPDLRSASEDYSVLMKDFSSILNPLEQLVLRQLESPNAEALIFATIDSFRKSDSIKVKIRPEHLAEGLGIPLDLFEATQARIQHKVQKYMAEQGEDTQYNVALRTLENIFSLHIPKSIDAVIVRRLLTIAARRESEKVNDQVRELLEIVGAKAPNKVADSVACFGVLYRNNHRLCMACGLKKGCLTECSNVGLGEITLSPKLLSARQLQRIPAVTGEATTDMPLLTERDDEIFVYLSENFKRIDHRNQVGFKHKEGSDRPVDFIVFLEDFKFYFLNPSETVSRKLEHDADAETYTIPEDMTAAEAIKLIAKHAEEIYATTSR